MTSSLQKYGNLIADQCISTAQKLKNELVNCVISNGHYSLTKDADKEIMLTLTFMNFFIASGVWSNLKNTKLRRDLMEATKESMIIRLASTLQKNQTVEDTAYEYVTIDFDKFQPYATFLKARIKDLYKSGISFDANSILLTALEWIQKKMNWDDTFMNKIVPMFVTKTEVLNELEYNISIIVEHV